MFSRKHPNGDTTSRARRSVELAIEVHEDPALPAENAALNGARATKSIRAQLRNIDRPARLLAERREASDLAKSLRIFSASESSPACAGVASRQVVGQLVESEGPFLHGRRRVRNYRSRGRRWRGDCRLSRTYGFFNGVAAADRNPVWDQVVAWGHRPSLRVSDNCWTLIDGAGIQLTGEPRRVCRERYAWSARPRWPWRVPIRDVLVAEYARLMAS